MYLFDVTVRKLVVVSLPWKSISYFLTFLKAILICSKSLPIILSFDPSPLTRIPPAAWKLFLRCDF